MRRLPALITLTTSVGLASCTGRADRDTPPSAAAVVQRVPEPAPLPATRPALPRRVVDTFDLASVGGRHPGDFIPTEQDCIQDVPASAYYALSPDSTYEFHAKRSARCPSRSPGDSTTMRMGRYSVLGDTLALYVGDGDEEFQSEFLKRSRDSLVDSSAVRTARIYLRRSGGAAQPRLE